MRKLLLGLGLLTFLGGLPWWLPARVVALRVRIFARVNGSEGLAVPVTDFDRLYTDPASGGRSRGAVLSDLFWYWLAPGPHVHQEHLEAGPRYDDVARTTRRFLVQSRAAAEEQTRRCTAAVLDGTGPGLVRLRELLMPVWAAVYYELVFGKPCPDRARRLIVANADDVVSALKCVRPRNMRRRARLTRYLRTHLGEVIHPLPQTLSPQEQAWYLQGTFFNTAVVQMSEAAAHVLMVLAKHPDVQRRLVEHPDDDGYLDAVIDETLRVYPLFGIAHRITTADIAVGGRTLAAGTVLCFSYPDYHRAGYPDPDRFDPDRWTGGAARADVNFVPFGVAQNRPCPARGLAPVALRVVAREVLARFALSSTAAHTRSMPNRGPVLLSHHGQHPHRPTLAWLAARDRAEDVGRSLVQLVFGSYMVWDARRKALCTNYFAANEDAGEAPRPACPVAP